MIFYGKSDVGVVRTENQDSFGIFELLPGVTLAMVCDGMGGAAGGSVASSLAVETFADMMREVLIPDSPEDRAVLDDRTVKRALTLSAEAANRAVWEKAHEKQDGRLDGMGTTLVGILTVGDERAWYINIGDSRLYFISNEGMWQLSHDHSYVQQMVDNGEMTAEEASASPMRNMITRAIGGDPTVEPDVRSVDFGFPEDGRRYLLLCSDGLYNGPGEQEIAGIIRGEDSISVKTERLVKAARNAGGQDNITVILVEIDN